MKSLKKQWVSILIAFLVSLITSQGQTSFLDNSSLSKTNTKENVDYAQVIIMVSTNNEESPEGAFVELSNLENDSTYSATAPENGTVEFAQVWNGEYVLTVSKEGFDTYIDSVSITEPYFIEEVTLAETLVTPVSLTATKECGVVYLEWESGLKNPAFNEATDSLYITKQTERNNSNNRELLGYNIYKNQTLINESPITATEYTDSSLLGGNFYYFVSAVYTTGESEASAPINVDVNYYGPPMNLEGETINWIDVYLEWDAPSPHQYFPIQWDNGENYTAVGTEEAYDFSVASRWYPEDLNLYDSMYLDKISFFPNEHDCEYYLRVWTGEEANLVVDQPLDEEEYTVHYWNTIELDNPVLIDANKELWFGYRANTEDGFPAGADAGPAKPYRGDMMWDAETGWVSLMDHYELDYNWNIAGILLNDQGEQIMLSKLPETSTSTKQGRVKHGQINQTPEPINFDSLEMITYNIYKDHELIEENWPLTTYIDDSISFQTSSYLYYVTATYPNGCVSDHSDHEEVIIYINSDENPNEEVTTRVFPNPVKNYVNFRFSNEVEIIRIYTGNGRLVYQADVLLKDEVTIDVSGYKPGIYIAKSITGKGKQTTKRFMVVNRK